MLIITINYYKLMRGEIGKGVGRASKIWNTKRHWTSGLFYTVSVPILGTWKNKTKPSEVKAKRMENGCGERPWWWAQWRGNGLPTCRLRAQSVFARLKIRVFSSFLYVTFYTSAKTGRKKIGDKHMKYNETYTVEK